MPLFVLLVLMVCLPAGGVRHRSQPAARQAKEAGPGDALLEVASSTGAKPDMSGPLCDAAEGNCDIEVAPKDELGMFHVMPGGDTSCLDGTPYSFQVRQGDPRKLHLHFQGGGACENDLSYNAGACTKTIEHEWQGVFNYTDPANVFQNYSVLVVNYCSGDLHAGNTDELWGSTMRKIRGYNNAMSAVSYAMNNFKDLDTVTFSGTSAGALGIHMWARSLVNKFRDVAKEMTVILDGWLDLPAHPSQETKAATHFCNLDILVPEDKEECHNSGIFLYSNFERAMVANPDVRFAVVNGAVDGLQVGRFGVGSEEFYKYETLLLNSDLRHPNFYVYLVQTNQHVFFTRPTFSITTPDSVDGSGSASPSLGKWVADFLVAPPQPPVVCAGEKKRVTLDTDVTGWGHEYCGLQ